MAGGTKLRGRSAHHGVIRDAKYREPKNDAHKDKNERLKHPIPEWLDLLRGLLDAHGPSWAMKGERLQEGYIWQRYYTGSGLGSRKKNRKIESRLYLFVPHSGLLG